MSDVITFVEGRIGRIRLNRPSAIHALTLSMCEVMLAALDAFEADERVSAVVIDHAEGRGFCAGGDIRMLAESGAGDGRAARAFFATEYRLNYRLFDYPKPTIAIMNGITMGGGVGLALPCDYRVATSKTRFAMPETGIGLFPDVGGGWHLSRLPGEAGTYIALTGARLGPADCFALGIATHCPVHEGDDGLPDDIADAIAWAAEHGWPSKDIVDDDWDLHPGRGLIEDRLPDIDRLFAGDRVVDVLSALDGEGTQWATEQAALLRTKSPLSLAVSLRLLKEGAAMPDFASEMMQEYAVGARMVHTHDFLEGVRAVIVDKDNAPKWHPATPDGVTDALIDSIFAPLPANEEWKPL